MSTEVLNFSITVSGTFWNKRPAYSIWINDAVVIQTELVDEKPQTHNFAHTVSSGENSIKIRLENKTMADTMVDENHNIVKDMLLNIEDITVDDVSLGELKWSGVLYPDTPQIYEGEKITELPGCVNLGWNGTYVLKFDSPFYIWLLENL